jgi:hypothetical protein
LTANGTHVIFFFLSWFGFFWSILQRFLYHWRPLALMLVSFFLVLVWFFFHPPPSPVPISFPFKLLKEKSKPLSSKGGEREVYWQSNRWLRERERARSKFIDNAEVGVARSLSFSLSLSLSSTVHTYTCTHTHSLTHSHTHTHTPDDDRSEKDHPDLPNPITYQRHTNIIGNFQRLRWAVVAIIVLCLRVRRTREPAMAAWWRRGYGEIWEGSPIPSPLAGKEHDLKFLNKLLFE